MFKAGGGLDFSRVGLGARGCLRLDSSAAEKCPEEGHGHQEEQDEEK